MMEQLGITMKNIDISQEVLDHFALIDHDPESLDITYENTQARYRTFILMNMANKHNGIVLGTGDMSELALGWCTYNGDQMSMYGINAGMPKTLVRYMTYAYGMFDFSDVNGILSDIIDTPISPELKPNQVTESSVGKYEINDYILYRMLFCGDKKERIIWLLQQAFQMSLKDASNYVNNFHRRFYTQQFKRATLPEGPKVLSMSLSPRGGYKIPSDLSRR
jgi:NAD+ synthase (glutamine-hydrolysing)